MTRMLFGRVCGGIAVLLTVMTLVTGANAAVVVQDLSPDDPLASGDSGTFLRFTANRDRLEDGEIIKFQVAEPARIDAVGITFNFLPFFGIKKFDVKLIKGTGPYEDAVFDFDPDDPDTETLPATVTPFGGALTLSYAGLLPEVTYGLVFTGKIKGLFGLYAGSFSISAVPLPPAVWLFLSALLGLAGVVRRRHKQLAQAGTVVAMPTA